MLPIEKQSLLNLFANQQRWCQGAEAKNEASEAVRYDDPSAVAWDITGGLCLLFGWRRALKLFSQLDRHIHHIKRSYSWGEDPGIVSMVAIQNHNDEDGTTYEIIIEWLESMPVWISHLRTQ